jgi:hypothetical protein
VQDAKLVDTACLALTRIAEAFSRSPAHLEMLCGFGLITSITQMVRPAPGGPLGVLWLAKRRCGAGRAGRQGIK